MKGNTTIGLIASLLVLFGQLIFFIILAFVTNEWSYVMWSFMVSMMAGLPLLIISLRAKKKEKQLM
ncbi:hypothetical protein [Alkalihalobacillus sp. R86527]|uniref:hypothetical protein n=1 Tax=Alkalihalobacillus sp. R86527 TaxID=3093863 RepID=UPI00366F37C4